MVFGGLLRSCAKPRGSTKRIEHTTQMSAELLRKRAVKLHALAEYMKQVTEEAAAAEAAGGDTVIDEVRKHRADWLLKETLHRSDAVRNALKLADRLEHAVQPKLALMPPKDPMNVDETPSQGATVPAELAATYHGIHHLN